MPEKPNWKLADDRISPASERVDVWRISHGVSDVTKDALAANLSVDEVKRARRFIVEHANRNFLLSRGGLRNILGRYLATDPRAIAFEYGTHGKPSLARAHAAAGICFNVSHSETLILVAVARARDLGIDIERVRTDVEFEQLAKRYFSAAESKCLFELEPRARPDAFFRCWTRKEAYLKLKGAGLSFPLDRFQVSLRDDEPPALLYTEVDGDRAEDWIILDLPIDDAYKAALVTGHPRPELRYWDIA